MQPAQHVFRLVLDLGGIQNEDDLGILRQPGIGGHAGQLETEEIENPIERHHDRDERRLSRLAIVLGVVDTYGFAQCPFDTLEGRGKNGPERIVHGVLRGYGAQDAVALRCWLEGLRLRYERFHRT